VESLPAAGIGRDSAGDLCAGLSAANRAANDKAALTRSSTVIRLTRSISARRDAA
jgi:hypothetical protein